jgi:iron(III) transport system substrate-binding protein
MKKSNVVASLFLTLITAGLMAACGNDPVPTATTQPTATLLPNVTPSPTPTPLADTFQQEWDALIKAAQAEGELVMVYGGSESSTGRFAMEAFANKFDIKVVTSAGAGSENANRILAERSRGVYTVDVTTVSGGSSERLRDAGAYQPIEPLLMHPEVTDRSSGWHFTEVLWSDQDKKYVMADSISVGEIGSIFYNSDNVTQAELDLIQDYWDLLRPEFKGRMAMRAMNNPGGKSVIARLWLAPGLGPDFLERLHRETDIDLVGSEADADLADGVAQGKWDFGIFGGSATFQALQALGLPVKDLQLTRTVGALSTEISGGVGVLDRAPHPNAAKLFVNWWYSREGQQASIDSQSSFGPLNSVSVRSDVSMGTFPARLQETLLNVPKWKAEGTLEQHLVVFETNDEWFKVREQSECFFNELYKELGYDAWINYTLECPAQ